MHEDTFRRAVSIRVNSHGAHAIVEFDLPCRLVGLEIDDRRRFGLDGAGHRIFPVRRDVNIVDASVDGDGLCEGERSCIDHVDGPGERADAHEYPATVSGYGEIVWPAAKRNFFDNFPTLAVNYVKHALRLIADVHA